MSRNAKRKLKKTLILTLPAAAVWAGLITGTCLSYKQMRSLANDRNEYQENLINKYTATEEYKQELENYENALQISLDSNIISKQEYDRLLEQKQSDEAILDQMAVDSNYIAEYQILQQKNDEVDKSGAPFCIFTTFAVVSPIAYPAGLYVFNGLNTIKKEREDYNKQFDSLTKEKN